MRGVDGESAGTVLSWVDDTNRYRFDQACRVKAIKGAKELGMTEHLSINFLPNAIYKPELCIRTTLEAARVNGFPLDRIIFEVTEGERITNSAHLKSIFSEYKKQGFLTAIDDFGAGYAGLGLLAEFQPDIIKLDMALIRNIDADRIRSIIVDSILKVALEIGIRVVAEGIETIGEFTHLREKGIRYFQGYLFAKPALDALPVEFNGQILS